MVARFPQCLPILCVILGLALPQNLTQHHRQLVLRHHNRFRRSLAQGLVLNKDGQALPGARNMLQKYNLGLERIASRWSENCKFEHSPPKMREFTGEALYKFTMNVEPGVLVDNATEFWWKELADLGIDPSLRFTTDDFHKGVGHFTQMAWGDTTSVGCGVSYCPDFALLVCNYSPAGNVFNKPIYEQGKPCTESSECTRYPGSKCSKRRGLCIRSRLIVH